MSILGWRNVSARRVTRYADQFMQLIRSACTTVEMAGDARRQQATSSAIEIVAVPIVLEQRNLFDDRLEDRNLLAEAIDRLVESERLEDRIERIGRRKATADPLANPRKLLFRADGGMLCPVDLWTTEGRRFGAVLALRTGPAGLRSGLMTPERSISMTGRAGLLPRSMALTEQSGLYEREGYLEIDTPTEDDFFRTLNLPMLPPEERR